MILLIGSPEDSTFCFFLRYVQQQRLPYLYLAQEDYLQSWSISGNGKVWNVKVGRRSYHLQEFTGIYHRLLGVSGRRPLADRQAYHWLVHFFDVAPIVVVNQSQAMGSNFSKPYQLQLIHRFFPVPVSCVTNQLQEIKAFQEKYPTCIFKSVSCERSIVCELDMWWKKRRRHLVTAPILLQQKLPGPNVRVHVVGNEINAVRIESDVVDYRYAKRCGKQSMLYPEKLAQDIRSRCIALTRNLGLIFSGIDLIYDHKGTLHCLEVNPSPGYSYFEDNNDQRISRALAQCLSHKGGL